MIGYSHLCIEEKCENCGSSSCECERSQIWEDGQIKEPCPHCGTLKICGWYSTNTDSLNLKDGNNAGS